MHHMLMCLVKHAYLISHPIAFTSWLVFDTSEAL